MQHQTLCSQHTHLIGMRLIIVLGDTRNDLYLSVERGEFERGGKSVQKNIEVTLYVLYADGDTLKVRAAGLIIIAFLNARDDLSEREDKLIVPHPPSGLHQLGQRRAQRQRVSLFCALPQQQPPLERDGQAAHSHRPFQGLPPALRVPTLLQ